MISAFGVDHGDISKGFGANAARLERAAASGGAHAEYAAARLKAGQQGAKVGPRLQTAANKKGLRRVSAQAGANRAINTGQAAKAKATGLVPSRPGGPVPGMRGSLGERFPNKMAAATKKAKKPQGIGWKAPVAAGVGGGALVAGGVMIPRRTQ